MWVQKVPYREKLVFWVWFRVVFWNVKNGVGNCGWNEHSRRRAMDPIRICVWVEHPTGVGLVTEDAYFRPPWSVYGSRWDLYWNEHPLFRKSLSGVRREMAYLRVKDPSGIRYCREDLGFPGSSYSFLDFHMCWIRLGSIQQSPENWYCFLWVVLVFAENFVTLHRGQDPSRIRILLGVIVPCMKIFRIFLDTYWFFPYLCIVNKNIEPWKRYWRYSSYCLSRCSLSRCFGC